MPKVPTIRLDSALVDRGMAKSKEQAQAMILAGEIFDDKGRRLDKASTAIPQDLPLEIRSRRDVFASRAGHKLEHALSSFGISVDGKVCLDVGASTGGFTDCLLKRSAKHVFAIDVGYGQLDSHLRNHPNVTNLERTNARNLTKAELESKNPLGAEVSFVVMDVSFISMRRIIEPLASAFPGIQTWVLLFKPQFEVAREQVKRGGIVKDEDVVRNAMDDFSRWMSEKGLALRHGPESSPLPGKKSGNVEYLLHYERN